MDVAAAVLGMVVPVAVVAAALHAVRGQAPRAVALRRSVRSRRSWLVVAPATIAVLALGVPFAYVEWGQDEAPPPLAFEPLETDSSPRRTSRTTSAPARAIPDPSLTVPTTPFEPSAGGTPAPNDGGRSGRDTTTTEAPTTPPNEVEGAWRVGRGSIAGYRAQEKLVAQDNTAAGRTSNVTGDMTIAGTTLTGAQFVVDMNAVTSDSAQRDERYRGIMDTAHHPTSRLVLTAPVEIGPVPSEGEIIRRQATGDFTIRGVTRSETFDLQARRVDGRIEVLGAIHIRWADYGVPDPSNGVVRVHDNGLIEFLLYLDRAS